MFSLEFEPWMLLIFPLFFGLGWLAARFDIKQLMSAKQTIPATYYQGLNHLLNEQQDKAIEAFIKVVQVDTQTIELHFALGNLFRRRGEIDRALRMHHNLADRADLTAAERQQAIFELAQDYLKAGILDRAEILLRQLERSTHAPAALQLLLELYQKEHDWLKAIDAARQLSLATKQNLNKLIAFFYSELAVEDMHAQNKNNAILNLEQSLVVYPDLVRANILLGQFAFNEQRYQDAICLWQNIEHQDAQYLSLVAGDLMAAYKAIEQETEGLTLLKHYLDQYSSLDLMNVVYDFVLEKEGVDAAYLLVRDQLRRNPTLLALNKLIEVRMLDVPTERQADLELVKELIYRRSRNLATYHCNHCGFKARQFYWHCPACQTWDNYAPRRDEEIGLQS